MTLTSANAVFLLVEDNPDHVLLLQRVFRRANLLNPIQVVRSGEEAIEYLSGNGRFADRSRFPLPTLVLLDLKMPGIDGFEILRWIRQQPSIASLRVVVLTTSEETRDVDLAYKCGANSFLVKPSDFDHFALISQALSGSWVWLGNSAKVSPPAPPAIPGEPATK